MNFFLNKNQKNFRGILIEERIFKFFFIFRVFPGFVLGMIRKFKKKKNLPFAFRARGGTKAWGYVSRGQAQKYNFAVAYYTRASHT